MLLTLPIGPLWQQASREKAPGNFLSARLLTCDEDRDVLFGVRYRGYRDTGYAIEGQDGKYKDPYDDLASTLMVGVYLGRQPVGTMRICFWQPGETGKALPCEKVYPIVGDIKAKAKGPIVELSRLAVEQAAGSMARRTAIYAQLVRMGIMTCLAMDVRVTLVASHEKWRHFYERIFGFRLIGGPEPYPPGNEPILLFEQDFLHHNRRAAMRNPFFRITWDEVHQLKADLGNFPGGFNGT